MSAVYLVVYEGRPNDLSAFVGYYQDHHVPLLWDFPGVRDVDMHVSEDQEIFLVTRLVFDTRAQLQRAIVSPERERARRDMLANFPPYEGRVRHVIAELVPTGPPS